MGSYCNQGKWINEYEQGKGLYYNGYDDDAFDLITTDESSCSMSQNDSVPQEKTSVIFRKIVNSC